MGEPQQLNTISQIDQPQRSQEMPRGLYLRTVNIVFILTAFLIAAALFLVERQVNLGYTRIQTANDRRFQAENAANNLAAASDYLTDRVRCFVVTADQTCADDFLTEVYTTRRRDTATETLKTLLGDAENEAYKSLLRARERSDGLVLQEYEAMRLVFEAEGQPVPDALLSAASGEGLSPQEMRERAVNLVFGDAYRSVKQEIQQDVNACLQSLSALADQELQEAGSRMRRLLLYQNLLTVALAAAGAVMAIYVSALVRKPLTRMVKLMRQKKTLPLSGAAELRYVARTYNEIFEENQKSTERLTYEAMHDGLTGVFNRYAFELLCQDTDLDHAALLIVDVDNFKGINDTYGHDAGDRILRRVADVLRGAFRSVDQIYRYGGDEFVVIMTRANSSMKDVVLEKIARANRVLQQPMEGYPPASLSVGVAFCDRENPGPSMLKDADTALYRVKQSGGTGCAVY